MCVCVFIYLYLFIWLFIPIVSARQGVPQVLFPNSWFPGTLALTALPVWYPASTSVLA